MAVCVVIGTDGSDDAVAAASRAVEVLAADATVHLISVAEEPDLATGGMVSGFAGGVATPDEVDRAWTAALVLILIVMVLNITARFIYRRFGTEIR